MPVKSQQPGSAEERTTGGNKPSQNINSVFDRIYSDYQLALQEIQADARRSFDEACSRLSRDVHKARVDEFLSAQESYNNYLALYQKSQKDPNQFPATEVFQGYRDYVKVYEAGRTETQKICAEAEQACRKEMERNQEEVRAKWRAAFRDYVLNLQKAWSEVDPDTVSAANLALVGQSIMAACTSAASEEQISGAR